MMDTRYALNRRLHFFFLVLICLLAACKGVPAASGGGPFVWIDVPIDGLNVPVDRAVQIEGHASYSGTIVRIEIWVDGELHLVEENPVTQGPLARFSQMWMPPGAGEYVVQAIAVGEDGAQSAPDVVRVRVGVPVAGVTPTATPVEDDGVEPTAVATAAAATAAPTDPAPTDVPTEVAPTAVPQPTNTPTPTPTPLPEAAIQFWADAEQVNAGACTQLRWQVENVKAVYLDDEGVTGSGAREICPCSDEVHTLTVTRLDDVQETRTITIQVVGSCTTPTAKPTVPPPDTTPPPAPVLVSPADDAVLACASEVTMEWNAVSDPSGIDEYQVVVQRHPGDFNWQPVSGSPWNGVKATELEIDVECGWTYRWRVRAVDGAGNIGSFSDWFTFTYPLA